MPQSFVNWGTSSLAYAGTQRVYVRQRWADQWSYQCNIWCEDCTWSLLPAMPTATFRLDYGIVLPHGGLTWTTQQKLYLGGWYVKVEFDCADGLLLWYGFIDESADNQGGRTDAVVSGQQHWIAYGMPQILASEITTRSRWWDDRHGNSRWSGSAVNFNDQGMPNRTDVDSHDATNISSHMFMPMDSTRSTKPLHWASRDIVKYLLNYAMPKDQNENEKIKWRVDSDNLIPDWDQPTLETEGRSVLSLFLSIVNTSRLLQFSTLVDEATQPNTVVLKVHSLASVDLQLPDGNTHDANDDVLSLTTMAAHDTQVATQLSESATVHQIVVKGALRESVASFAISTDGTELLDEGWTQEHFDAYLDGASGNAGYAVLNAGEKRDANELVRSQARLHDVFRTFEITSEWDFRDGAKQIFEVADDDTDRYFPYWNSINIRDQLPFKQQFDYADTAIADGVLERGLQDFRGPYVLFKRPGISQYHQAEKMANYNADPMFSVEVGVDRDGQALTLHVIGTEQHAIAFGTFVQLPVEVGDYLIWDYRECICTLSLQEDRYAEARYPEDADLPERDAIRRKIIYAGPGYEQTTVIPFTAVDVDNDGELKTSTGGYLHDDRERLKNIAQIAAAFWLVPRHILRLYSARPTATPAVGMLVDVINPGTAHETQIDTVISEIRLATPLGEDGPAETASYSIVTALGEFDPVAFVPVVRH